MFRSEPGSAPRNIQVRLLSSSTMVIQWEEPETPNGQVIVSTPIFAETSVLIIDFVRSDIRCSTQWIPISSYRRGTQWWSTTISWPLSTNWRLCPSTPYECKRSPVWALVPFHCLFKSKCSKEVYLPCIILHSMIFDAGLNTEKTFIHSFCFRMKIFSRKWF